MSALIHAIQLQAVAQGVLADVRAALLAELDALDGELNA